MEELTQKLLLNIFIKISQWCALICVQSALLMSVTGQEIGRITHMIAGPLD